MVPCLIREDFVCDEVDGKMYTYCSEGCRWTHKVAFAAEYEPCDAGDGPLQRSTRMGDCYHGWDVADAIGSRFVRPDGRTMIAQPHLRFEQGHVDGVTCADTLAIPLRGFRALADRA
jgi:propane monooxygenase large subunit